jgi:coenzyme F420-0:L-glutamate ligase / coenzyme F420-1:gamma-L-glutamate ligase
MDNLQSLFRSRRSIRLFRPDPIPEDILTRVLETACYAPSAHNLQPWRFVILIDGSSKLRLAKKIAEKYKKDMTADSVSPDKIKENAEKTLSQIVNAPVVIIPCRDITQVKKQPDGIRQEIEHIMGIQSVAACCSQLLLAAHFEGLGGVWICWPLFARNETRSALELQKNWEPQCMLLLGYPAEKPETPPRIPLDQIRRYL